MFSFAVAVPMTRKLGHGPSVFPPANDSPQTGYFFLSCNIFFSFLFSFLFFFFSIFIQDLTQKNFVKKISYSIYISCSIIIRSRELSIANCFILGSSREFFSFNLEIE